MRQYESEQADHGHAVRSSSTEHRRSERSFPAVPESSTTPSGRIRTLVRGVSMKSLAESAAQPNARASLLQLQRQHGNQYVQRLLQVARSAADAAHVTPDVERAIESSRGGGQSLDSGIQAQMGHTLNADFSGVRVHTDRGADDLNRSLGATAFTTGRDIYFREGAYSPGSSGGRELLAHELTHVVQQNPDKVQTKPDDDSVQGSCACGGSPAPGPQMKMSVSHPGDIYEQEADRIAGAVMQQERQGHAESLQGQWIHRQMPEDEDKLMQGKLTSAVQRQPIPEEDEGMLGGAAMRKEALAAKEEAPTV